MRLVILLVAALLTSTARADVDLRAPLELKDVVTLARSRRAEIAAARARARAVAQRPAIVSALEDPTVAFSIDHQPFSMFGKAMPDSSFMIEQTFPLSRIRSNRAGGARAEARRELANADRVGLDVELDAAGAFYMLSQTRATATIIERQLAIARQLVAAATARYSSGTGTQSDVLRAELEVARLEGERKASAADVRGAEVMLNTTIARDPDAPIPDLSTAVSEAVPPMPDALARAATGRPELQIGRAEIDKAEADVRVMRSMYAPMGMVRTGPSYTMGDGAGWMVMVGISVPLWRGKLRAGVAEANAMVDMANADLDAMKRMVDGQARIAREAVVAARERFLALRDGVLPRAEQAIAPTLAAYSAGQVPLVSVVEAAQALWIAQRELAVARAELGIMWARLHRAIGQEITP